MPPRHRKEIADEVNPPELDDSRKQIAEKDSLIAAADQAGAGRHLSRLVTSGQLCPDLRAGMSSPGSCSGR
jgi:hypothetical protein